MALLAPFTRIDSLTTVPGVIRDPRRQARLAQNRLGTVRPDVPVYLCHGTVDELIPYRTATGLRDRCCALGADLQWTSLPLAGHVVAVGVGGTNALNWLGDRFAGQPTRPSC